MNDHRIVFFSGGVGSWAAARRVVEKHGAGNLHPLFTDTIIEDEDLYRFLVEAAADVFGVTDFSRIDPDSIPKIEDGEEAEIIPVRKALLAGYAERAMQEIPGFHWISEGRTPWEVFRDERFIANTRVDICSRVLKRDLANTWLENRFPVESMIRIYGIDWTEEHRLTRMQQRYAPCRCEGPLTEPPYLCKADMLSGLNERGIETPRLYKLGAHHNNCGMWCVKAGQGHFYQLLQVLPKRYGYHEGKEQDQIAVLGDVAIMRDRKGGKSRPLTMKEFRESIAVQPTLVDLFEIGGCGCMLD